MRSNRRTGKYSGVSGDRLEDSIATIAELAERTGSDASALSLLRRLDIPVVQGVFSQRLLLERLETYSGGARPPGIAVAARELRKVGIEVERWNVGRPTLLGLTAIDGPVTLGFGDEILGAVTIAPGKASRARVYTASTRTSGGKATFTASGFEDEDEDCLFLFVLLEDETVWAISARELRWVAREIEGGRTRDQLARNFVPHKRGGALRASFPKNENNDWLLQLRVGTAEDA